MQDSIFDHRVPRALTLARSLAFTRGASPRGSAHRSRCGVLKCSRYTVAFQGTLDVAQRVERHVQQLQDLITAFPLDNPQVCLLVS